MIQWNNVSQPNLSDASLDLKRANDMMQDGLKTTKGIFTQLGKIQENNIQNQKRLNTEQALMDIQSIDSQEQLSSTTLDSIISGYGNNVDRNKVFNALRSAPTELEKRNQADFDRARAVAKREEQPFIDQLNKMNTQDGLKFIDKNKDKFQKPNTLKAALRDRDVADKQRQVKDTKLNNAIRMAKAKPFRDEYSKLLAIAKESKNPEDLAKAKQFLVDNKDNFAATAARYGEYSATENAIITYQNKLKTEQLNTDSMTGLRSLLNDPNATSADVDDFVLSLSLKNKLSPEETKNLQSSIQSQFTTYTKMTPEGKEMYDEAVKGINNEYDPVIADLQTELDNFKNDHHTVNVDDFASDIKDRAAMANYVNSKAPDSHYWSAGVSDLSGSNAMKYIDEQTALAAKEIGIKVSEVNPKAVFIAVQMGAIDPLDENHEYGDDEIDMSSLKDNIKRNIQTLALNANKKKMINDKTNEINDRIRQVNFLRNKKITQAKKDYTDRKNVKRVTKAANNSLPIVKGLGNTKTSSYNPNNKTNFQLLQQAIRTRP